MRVGRDSYDRAVASLHWRMIAGIGFVCVGLLAVLSAGWALYRGACGGRSPSLEQHMRAISRKEMTAASIEAPAAREFRGAFAMLRAMRAHLAFADWQRAKIERRSDAIRRETVEAMAHARSRPRPAVRWSGIGQSANTMFEEAGAMTESAGRVNAHAEQTSSEVDQALKNAQIVAAASEQLAASIRAVSSQVEHASSVAHEASAKGGERAAQTIHSLADAGGADQHRGAADRRHRQPDQPAGAERHDRSGARRRGRQRLRGGGQ